MNRRTLTILNYAVNGLGMGHISRLTAISRWVRRLAIVAGYRPEIVFLTTSEADTLLFRHGFASLKIPSKTIIREQGLTAARWRFLSRQWVWNCFAMLQPDVVVVDTFPLGSFNELGNVLDGDFRRVFVYRSVRPESVGAGFRQALSLYDSLITIAEQGDAPFAVPDELSEKTSQTGAIMLFDRHEILSRSHARELLDIPPDTLTCYVSAGGGGDRDAEETFRLIAEYSRAFPDFLFVFGAGPLYRSKEFRQSSVRWLYRYDAMEYFSAFDCAVSAGGYNSVHELLYAGIPSGFFPQPRMYDNQEDRIARLAASGACFDCGVGLERLGDFLETMRNPSARATFAAAGRATVPENHARNAAHIIVGNILPAERLNRADTLLFSDIFGKVRKNGLLDETYCSNLLLLRQCYPANGQTDIEEPLSRRIAEAAFMYLDEVRRYINADYRSVKFLKAVISGKSGQFSTPEDAVSAALESFERATRRGYMPDEFTEQVITTGEFL